MGVGVVFLPARLAELPSLHPLLCSAGRLRRLAALPCGSIFASPLAPSLQRRGARRAPDSVPALQSHAVYILERAVKFEKGQRQMI